MTEIISLKHRRCRICEYWTLVETCPIVSGFGDCNCPKLIEKAEIKEVASDALIYTDRWEQGAYLHTGPDFGCIHFEVKEGVSLIVQYSHPHTPGQWWTFGTDQIFCVFHRFDDALEQVMKVGDIYAGNPWYRRIVDQETGEVLYQRNGYIEVSP